MFNYIHRMTIVIIFFLFIPMFPIPSFSATLGVINTNDSGPGSLREVVETLAQDGDEIIFNIPSAPPHNIILTSGQITVSNSITIKGPGNDELTIDGSANERIFQILSASSDIDVSISGMRLTNGLDSGGGAIRNYESLTLTDVVIIDNHSLTGLGGGGILNSGDVLRLVNSALFENFSNFGGGIVNRPGGTLILEFSAIALNGALVQPTSTGGGIHNAGDLIISNSSIAQNIASATGGGINNTGSMEIHQSAIALNFANSSGGGGINNRTTERVVITNTTISENGTDTGNGGGIRNTRGTIDITNSTIAENVAYLGRAGGIFNHGGGIPSVFNIKNSLVVGNMAPTDPNCTDLGANSDINDIANNISDDVVDACAIFFDGTFDVLTMLGPLQNNGGFALTRELLGPPNPAINGVPDGECTDQGTPQVTIASDARTFPRPGDIGVLLCDIGAFELQPVLTLTVSKNTVPPGSKNFEFFGDNSIVEGCSLNNTILNDGDSISCLLPREPFTILENPTPGFESSVFCASILATFLPDSGPQIGGLILPDAGFDDEIISCEFTNEGLPTITVLKEGTGSGTVSSDPPGIDCGEDCVAGYDPGTVVTLTVNVDGSSSIGNWGGACSGYTGDQAMVRVDQLKTCTISFDLNSFDLNINIGGSGVGNISAPGIDCGDGGMDCTEVYTSGTVIDLIPTPGPGSVFTGFTGDLDCRNGEVSMISNITCTAIFEVQPLILNAVMPGLANTNNTISAEQTSPGGNVAFVWGFMSGTTTIGGSTCAGLVIDINRPRLLSIVGADPDGIAEYQFFIPQFGDFEIPIITQAIDINTCRKSDTRLNTIKKEL